MSSPTPIMLMVRQLGPGGTERQLTELARSLDRSTFQVHVGCFHEGLRAEELRRAGIPIARLPVSSFGNLSAVAGAYHLGQYLRKHRIRLVHTFDSPLNCFGVPVAKLFRVPVVLSSQRAHRHLTSPTFLKVLRFTDRLVNGIIVNSEAVRREMIEQEKVPGSRVHLCYNGIDTEHFHPRDRQRVPGLKPASLVIGVVCVLRPEKGLTTLLKAFAAALTTDPAMLLVIVGSGPELPRLQNLAQELQIQDRCIFQPAVPDVAPWLRSIDIFVLPSLSEALSNSLMEAMACGCVCLASRVGGNPELIQDGAGLLFEASDVKGLAAQLSFVAKGRELRSRLAAGAASLIQRKFSLSASVSRMQEIYWEQFAVKR